MKPLAWENNQAGNLDLISMAIPSISIDYVMERSKKNKSGVVSI
jgi:hypothetical protein